MPNSSPEGIELGKGGSLISASLSIDKEKVFDITSTKQSLGREEIRELIIKFHNEFSDRWNIDDWINKNL
jgi:hypothetical protein